MTAGYFTNHTIAKLAGQVDSAMLAGLCHIEAEGSIRGGVD